MKKFKDGDKVYCPKLSNKVLEVSIHAPWRESPYPIGLLGNSFTIDGRHHDDDNLPLIFHATEENHLALEQLYGVRFEKPRPSSTPPSSREIIKAMLARGDKNVLCWVGDTPKDATSGHLWRFITDYNENSDYPYVSERGGSVGSWVFAIPIDPRTERPITEIPE